MIDVLEIITEVLASCTEAYIMYDIYQILLSGKRHWNKSKENCLIMFLSVLLVQCLNHISLFSYTTIIIMVLFWSITAKYLYSVNYTTVLSIGGFYMLAMAAYEFFAFSTMGAFWGGYDAFLDLIGKASQSRMIVVFCTKLMWAICYLFVRRFLIKFQFNKASRDFLIKTSVVGCVACLILAKLTFDHFPDEISQIWFIVVCVLVCLIFYHSFAMNIKTHKAQLEMTALQNKLLEENFIALNDVYSLNAKLHHDLNNHLDTLYQLLDANMVTDAKDYIERISEPIKDLNKVIWTGVDVVDVILNSKLEKARKIGIHLSYNVEYPTNSSIQTHDICTILSNLIDNAIEATAKGSDAKEIKVTIRKINNFMTIQVVNEVFEPIRTKSSKIVTTKIDSVLHGWGLQSIQAAVEKYDGSVKYDFDNHKFTATVILFF